MDEKRDGFIKLRHKPLNWRYQMSQRRKHFGTRSSCLGIVGNSITSSPEALGWEIYDIRDSRVLSGYLNPLYGCVPPPTISEAQRPNTKTRNP